MLTKEGCRSRQKRLWDSVPANVEWMLIADPRHVNYLSAFWVQPLSFSGGERGLLLLERNGPTTLFGDNFAVRAAAGPHFADQEVVEKWYDHKHTTVNRDHVLFTALRSVAEKLGKRRGAIESEWLPVGAREVLGSPTIDDVDLGSALRRLRRQKEADEVALLKSCMRATDAGHKRAREVVKPGVTELDVYREVLSAVVAEAGRAVPIYGDFRAATKQQPKAGGLPTNYKLAPGDLFILDYSVVFDGYRSDFTNTIAVGEPSAEQQKLFAICQAAMKSGEESLRAGVRAADVYAAVSRPMVEAGRGPLGHHAGHGIGLAHPEYPILVPESDETLLAGDVVTLEPGQYQEGVGGMRIEHNYLIGERGADRLSDHVISLT
ncbi:MAG: M24 family metallopeptidase [Planctomycetaceae bacterium]